MGFPGWKAACDWLDGNLMAPEPSPSTAKGTSLKNPEIPELKDYSSLPGEEFSNCFPRKALPEKAETEVLTDIFEDPWVAAHGHNSHVGKERICRRPLRLPPCGWVSC